MKPRWTAGFFIPVKRYLLLTVLIGVIASRSGAEDTLIDIMAADSAVSDTARIIIRVERIDARLGRFVDTIDVSLQSTGQLAAGFDFKIATSNQYLTIIGALPGEIFDSCGWDYFSARPLDRSKKPGSPQTLWQTVGMAEGITNQEPARCYGLDRQASLVRLIVSNEHVVKMIDTSVAIYFLWEDCTDNVVSSATGEKLYISTNVLDYFPIVDSSGSAGFPTRRGAPKQCQKPGSLNPAKRRVEFHNGGVRFSIPSDLVEPVIMEPEIPDSVSRETVDSAKIE